MREVIGLVAVVLATWSPALVAAQTSKRDSTDSAQATPSAAGLRMTVMQEAIRRLEASSGELDEGKLAFAAKPLLRYSDPTRDLDKASPLLDATVWRLGQQGRPTGLVTLELYRAPDKPTVLAFEFVSLVPEPFALSLRDDAKVKWKATGTEFKRAVLADGPRPAKTATARLQQMRQLARRFAVLEKFGGEEIDCRLLTQPIDRYESPDDGIVDGAIFAFANGTNPEAAILLECDDTTWWHANVRMGAAELTVELDDRPIARYPFFGDYGRSDGAYTSTSHEITLPQGATEKD
jgi:hypothetical protein